MAMRGAYKLTGASPKLRAGTGALRSALRNADVGTAQQSAVIGDKAPKPEPPQAAVKKA